MVCEALAVKTPIFLVYSTVKRFECIKQLAECVETVSSLAEMLAGIAH